METKLKAEEMVFPSILPRFYKIPVCDKCHKICEYRLDGYDGDDGIWQNFYVSECCDADVTFYDDIKEVILLNLE